MTRPGALGPDGVGRAGILAEALELDRIICCVVEDVAWWVVLDRFMGRL